MREGGGPGGRPSKYDPAYCEAVIEYMADGSSLTSFAASIGVSRSTVTEWAAVHPEFSASVNVGKAKCAAWWEKVNRRIAVDGGGTGSAQACALGLKNMAREDWVERSEVDLNIKDDLAAAIEEGRKRAHGDQG